METLAYFLSTLLAVALVVFGVLAAWILMTMGAVIRNVHRQRMNHVRRASSPHRCGRCGEVDHAGMCVFHVRGVA